MLEVVEMVLQGGYVKLKAAFTTAFPGVMHNQQYARRRLLQMPLVCLCIDYRPGVSDCILLEFVEGVNYNAFLQLLHNVLKQQPKRASFIDKN